MRVPVAVGVARLLAALGDHEPVAVVRDGEAVVVGVGPDEELVASGAGALHGLDRLAPGWWAGWLAYDLGRAVERVPVHAAADPPTPDVVFTRFAARAVFGRAGVTVAGRGPDARALRRVLRRAAALGTDASAGGPWSRADRVPEPCAGTVGWRSSLSRDRYEAGVRAIQDRIRDGDCYQVNLTRRLRAAVPGEEPGTYGRALYGTLARRHPSPHLAMVRHTVATVVCASPERFLRIEGPSVETRPIKGTDTCPDRLARSDKDRAENVMIVDLARNDLGRVCVPGTVRVSDLCRVEAHPGLVHLVSTVRGRVRDDVGPGGLIRATFPPASVTGAPKPAALTLIERLEPVRRGVYCGAVGFLDTAAGRADLAVAIRTFVVHAGGVDLGVGAGITAGSVPEREWAETELKAARLVAAAEVAGTRSAREATGPPPGTPVALGAAG